MLSAKKLLKRGENVLIVVDDQNSRLMRHRRHPSFVTPGYVKMDANHGRPDNREKRGKNTLWESETTGVSAGSAKQRLAECNAAIGRGEPRLRTQGLPGMGPE